MLTKQNGNICDKLTWKLVVRPECKTDYRQHLYRACASYGISIEEYEN